MAGDSKIEWTDATWNPIVGCSIVSPGCTNCYAMKMAARIEKMSAHPMAAHVKVQTHYAGTTEPSRAGPVWTGRVAKAPDHIFEAPLRWRKPRKIFVNSMGDLFHEAIEDWQIALAFGVMTCATQHTYQVLTKRSARMQSLLSSEAFWDEVNCFSGDYAFEHSDSDNRRTDDYRATSDDHDPQNPPSNIWLGVSCERQQEADERIPHLLQTPAAIRFVSAEPLLGRIYLEKFLQCTGMPDCEVCEARGRRLDWIIVGGESGPHARPMHPQWARDIRDQCHAAGVAFFFKQWGRWFPFDQCAANDRLPDQRQSVAVFDGQPNDYRNRAFDIGKKSAGRLLDGKQHNAFPNPQPSSLQETARFSWEGGEGGCGYR